MKGFTPDAGKYRKIDIYANDIDTGAVYYLHSTNAYKTLKQAEIGATLALEKTTRDNKQFHYTEKVYKIGISSGLGFEQVFVNPFTVRAFFSEGR